MISQNFKTAETQKEKIQCWEIKFQNLTMEYPINEAVGQIGRLNKAKYNLV